MGRGTQAALFAALLAAVVAVGYRCGRPQPLPEFAPAAAPAPAAPAAKPVPADTAMVAPRLLNLPELQASIRKYYPEDARRGGQAGRVTLSMRIGVDGKVGSVSVERSGGADFDAAALKAAAAMRFSPAKKSGRPVAVDISDVIEFDPDGR